MTPSGAYASNSALKMKFPVCIKQIYSKRATTNVRNQKFLWHLAGIPLGKLLSYANESFVKTFILLQSFMCTSWVKLGLKASVNDVRFMKDPLTQILLNDLIIPSNHSALNNQKNALAVMILTCDGNRYSL